MGREFLLMVDRQKSETALASLRKHMERGFGQDPRLVFHLRVD